MQIAITKSQLKALQEHRGEVDVDTGRVFTRLVARLVVADGLYHGTVELSDPDPDRTDYETFRLVDIVSTNPAAPPSAGPATVRRGAPALSTSEDEKE